MQQVLFAYLSGGFCSSSCHCLLLQLQTMRMRCEKRKQKDAIKQPAELTAEQIAERKAQADAFAEVSQAMHFQSITSIL